MMKKTSKILVLLGIDNHSEEVRDSLTVALQQEMEQSFGLTVKVELGEVVEYEKSYTQCFFKIFVPVGGQALAKRFLKIYGIREGLFITKDEATWIKGLDGEKLFHDKVERAYIYLCGDEQINKKRNLFEAVIHATPLMFDEILKSGGDVCARNHYNSTPLHCAAAHGEVDKIQSLLLWGAEVDATDSAGATPLFWASRITIFILTVAEKVKLMEAVAIFRRVTEILIKNGADMYAKDKCDCLPFITAILESRNKKEAVEKFIEFGVNLDITSFDGATALHYASESMYFNVAKALISAGANIDTQNDYGETSLHLVLRYPCKCYLRYKTVKTLINLGARTDIPDCTNETVEDLGVWEILQNPPKSSQRCKPNQKCL